MALVNVIKHDQSNDTLFIWKHPETEIKIGSQLVVHETQEAVFVKNGEIFDVFGPGTHTLVTGNIPLLEKLINLPYGGATPFSTEIWFINKLVKRDLKWGTQKPVPLLDDTLNFPVSIRAFGKWGARLKDGVKFIRQIVGTQFQGDTDKISNYFIGEITQRVVNVISNQVTNNKQSFLSLSSMVDELSAQTLDAIVPELERFGLEVVNFNIESITIPPAELEKIQDVLSKAMEAKKLSEVQDVNDFYRVIKSFEVLDKAAENQGEGSAVGALLGAGIGLGAGLPIGQQIGANLNTQSDTTSETDPTKRLKKAKQLFADGLINEDEYTKLKSNILKDI